MENFKLRHERIKFKINEKYKKLNIDQEKRHENNLLKLYSENELLSKKNDERLFKKYVSFYWTRKTIEKEFKQKRKEITDKLAEKSEKMQLLEKINEKRRNNILKKIKCWDARKKESEKNKLRKIMDTKRIREERNNSCAERRKEFLEEESERRKDILFYQSQIFMRSLSRDNIFLLKKNNAHEKTSQDQILLERNLMSFNKQMNILKSQSILKKSFKEKMKIFKELKRKEAEKKKEMEEKLK